MKNKRIMLGLLLLSVPSLVFGAVQGLKVFLADIAYIIDLLGPLVVALAMLFFFWGTAQFILKFDDKTKEEGKKKMMWGIVALFVIFSITGILNVMGDALGISASASSPSGSLPTATSNGIIPITGAGSMGGLPPAPGSGGSDFSNPTFPTFAECERNPDLCQGFGGQ